MASEKEQAENIEVRPEITGTEQYFQGTLNALSSIFQ